MKTGPKRPADLPSKKEIVFIEAILEGEPPDVARKRAGYKSPAAATHLLKRPRVIDAINKLKEKGMAAAGARVARKFIAVDVTRNDIISGLAKEARFAESDSARVTAWGKLAEIFQLTQKSSKDADLFAGWTDDELETYRDTGELPLRFRPISGPSQGNEGTPTPAPAG